MSMINDDFKLDSSVASLPPVNSGKIRPQMMQVSSQKANTGDSFPLGVQEYKFAVSDSTWFIPSKSYFVLRCTLSRGDDVNLGTAGATVDTAPTMGMISSLFQSCEFRVGGKTLQRITQFMPQVDSLLHRTTKSKPYLDSIGEASNFWSESFTVRQREVDVGPHDERSAREFDLIWKPPLGIFHDYDGALPAGEYSIVLTPQPSSQYKLGVIESLIGAGDQPVLPANDATGYKFSVDRLELQVATIEGPRFDSGSYAIPLTQIECQSAKIQTASLSQHLFSVSAATKSLAVAYQDTRLADGRCSRSKFVVLPDEATGSNPSLQSNNLALGLNRLYVQYDSIQRPSPDADPEFDALSVDRTVQRYYETMTESGMIYDPAGCEKLAEHHRRGSIYYFNWNRSSKSGATRVQTNSQFAAGTDITNANILLFSISETSAKISVKNGTVVSVETVER